ncbi:deoxynucleoside triphosphate triphosphohydrolase [Canna indica]|uniref:Deoxynucleoside triphosphate triphosphohydrolase n=1 Tax=Canna indica TaxID=4628 RepID=A0AAQ3KCT7_9LILI|nr:deoxynucleoside triphosphate triphosphohydrolase [Canna indica]
MVYPGAVHTRFEHSLGVYWLAGEAVRFLQTYRGSEICIDYHDLTCLLHDIGHGPFSHLFEHEFLPLLPGSECRRPPLYSVKEENTFMVYENKGSSTCCRGIDILT